MLVFEKPLMDLFHVWQEYTLYIKNSKMLQKGKVRFQVSCPVCRQVLSRHLLSLAFLLFFLLSILISATLSHLFLFSFVVACKVGGFFQLGQNEIYMWFLFHAKNN